MDFQIWGHGGGGKGGGGGGVSESPDTLRSSEKAVVLDALCEGPIQGLVNGAQSVYFDGVPLQNADGTWNFNQAVFGYTTGTLGSNADGASALTGDASSVESTVSVGTKIYQGTPLVRSITTANVDSARVTLNVPSLTSTDANSGQINGTSVEFSISVQTNGGGYVERVHDTFNGKTNSNYARSYLIPLTGSGPWDIKVTRITPDSGSSLLINDIYWQDYTAIISTHLEYRHTAMAYVAIDAQQFSSIPSRAYDIQGLVIQVPSNYSPAARSYTGTWDGTFKLAWSDNPAWCFYDLVTNGRYGLGDMIPASALDKWQLYIIGQYCDGLVPDGYGGTEPRFTCNLLLQGEADAYTVVQNMAAIFRAMAFWSAGSIALSQDSPASPIQSFTPANVVGGLFSYQGTSLKARHTVALVTWNDPNQQYAPVVEYVQNDALVAKYGVIKAQVTAMGCTSRGQAHRLGQWLLYTENLETETVSFKCALDGTFLVPGAIIQTSDPNRAGARMGGRLLDVSTDGLTLTLDAAPPSGQELAIQVMLPDGSMGSGYVSTTSGTAVTLSATLPSTPAVGAIYVLSDASLQPELWRVVTVTESGPNEVEVGALSYNPSKYGYIENNLALATPQISTISAVPAVPTNLSLVIGRYISDIGPAGIRGTLSWTGSASSYIVTMQKAGSGIVSQTVNQCSVDFENIDLSQVYTFGVTAVSAVGTKSAPAQFVTTPTSSQLDLTPLPVASSLTVTPGPLKNTLAWAFDTTRTDIKSIEIWGSGSAALGASITLLATLGWPASTWTHSGLSAGVPWYYWIRVVDTIGIDGGWSAVASGVPSNQKGTTTGGPAVQDATVTVDSLGNATISFSTIADPQIKGYELRSGVTFETGTIIADSTTAPDGSGGNSFTLPVLSLSGLTLWIKGVYANGGYTATTYEISFGTSSLQQIQSLSWRVSEPDLVFSWAPVAGASQYVAIFEDGGVSTIQVVSTPQATFGIPKWSGAVFRVFAIGATGGMSPYQDETITLEGVYYYNEVVNITLPITSGNYINMAFTAANQVRRVSLLGAPPANGVSIQNINDQGLYSFGYNLTAVLASNISGTPAAWFRQDFWEEKNGFFESGVVDLGAVLSGKLLLNLTKTVTYTGDAAVSAFSQVLSGYMAKNYVQEIVDDKAFLTVKFLVASDSPNSANWTEYQNGDWISAGRYVKLVVQVALAGPLTDVTVTAAAITLDVPDVSAQGTVSGVTTAGTPVTTTTTFHHVDSIIVSAQGNATAYTSAPTINSDGTVSFTVYVSTGTQTVGYFIKGY